MTDWQPMETAPRDGREVKLLVRHRHWYLAHGEQDRERWQGVVRAHWIEHNGGGWTYYGMLGEKRGWKELR